MEDFVKAKFYCLHAHANWQLVHLVMEKVHLHHLHMHKN